MLKVAKKKMKVEPVIFRGCDGSPLFQVSLEDDCLKVMPLGEKAMSVELTLAEESSGSYNHSIGDTVDLEASAFEVRLVE